MKRNKIVALLMAGIISVSQPASIYAVDITDIITEDIGAETDAEESEPLSEDTEEVNEESPPIVSENSIDASDLFTDSPSTEQNPSEFDSEMENENSISVLTWNGKASEDTGENTNVSIQKEDSSKMDASDMVSVETIEQDLKKEIENKIQNQQIGMSISSVLALKITRKDANGIEKENNLSYKVQIKMPDISQIKTTKLYHQKENGDIEELTYTCSNTEDGQQMLEFVSTEGLGCFVFANAEKDLTVSDNQDTVTVVDADTGPDLPDLTVNDSPSEENKEENSESKQESEDKKDEPQGSDSGDEISPVIIDDFNVTFVSGADNIDGKNIWSPSDPMLGHAFIYRVDYTMSGLFSTDIGAFRIEVPLHILKDKDGNWADEFNCPYSIRSAIADGDNLDFVYEVDEENNKVIIYNYKPYPTGEAGYIEFAYETSEKTMKYLDMCNSTKVKAKVFATNEAATVTAESEADEVYIDTHATIAYTQKKKPKLYLKWEDSWGEKPEDADDYWYLIWPIRTYINKNTSNYDFYLEDTFSDMGGSLVGYRFSGQTEFSDVNHVDNQSSYGDRYDSVLTRYDKSKADEVLKTGVPGYYIHNDIKATVSPVDHVDEDTNATSSYDWYYKAPVYVGSQGEFGAAKYGIYGDYSIVENSEDVSNYMLGEFESGEVEALPNLKYYVTSYGSPYPYTLGEGADGTVNDALNGLYGQKKVDYEVIDDGVYIEKTKLEDDDYDIVKVELAPLMRDAMFNPETYEFQAKAISDYKKEDAISILVRTNDGWKKAAVYDMTEKKYIDTDEKYVKKTSGKIIEFQAGVKALKFTCSNAYYYTSIKAYPEISMLRTDHVFDILKNDPQKISVSNKMDFNNNQGRILPPL